MVTSAATSRAVVPASRMRSDQERAGPNSSLIGSSRDQLDWRLVFTGQSFPGENLGEKLER